MGTPESSAPAKVAFEHVIGVGIGSMLGAAGFAIAHRSGFLRAAQVGTTKEAAILGAVLAGISTLGTGNGLYELLFSHRRSRPASHVERLEQERLDARSVQNIRS